MKELDDEQLADMAGKGEARAFEELALRHADRVFRMAWRWCGNRADAEDITQDVFMKLAQKIHHYRPKARFTTWLYQVTLNEARDHFRRESRRLAHESAFTAQQPRATDGEQERRDTAEKISAMLHRLPDGEKEAVLLVVCDGLSHGEAALVLGCAEKTVTWRIFSARKKLTEWYGHAG